MPYLHLRFSPVGPHPARHEPRPHQGSYVRTVEKFAPPVRTSPSQATSSSDSPGETDADFEATLAMCALGELRRLLSFKYSRRAGTPAAAMAGQVDEAVKDELLIAQRALLDEQRRAFNRPVGRTIDVLFERPGPPTPVKWAAAVPIFRLSMPMTLQPGRPDRARPHRGGHM